MAGALRCQRVSHNFHDLINASSAIQEKLHFKPAPIFGPGCRYIQPQPHKLLLDAWSAVHSTPRAGDPSVKVQDRVSLLHLSYIDRVDYHVLPGAKLLKPGWWSKMFVLQPPDASRTFPVQMQVTGKDKLELRLLCQMLREWSKTTGYSRMAWQQTRDKETIEESIAYAVSNGEDEAGLRAAWYGPYDAIEDGTSSE
ncbi:hypothetical protein B0A48_04595 [Cryoendolithus antarcticus]|uniref:Uncharacterized protein n=1 Tax=Cryoendolithus antarcticus TaxID=1507870 RepID=A0A1V8TFS9_9PEZI|nr:hypothetical protein B0A48_04595 [Cryoendolithus antarcticus]